MFESGFMLRCGLLTIRLLYAKIMSPFDFQITSCVVVSHFTFSFSEIMTFFGILDMTRQYKAMQNEMSMRIHQLETELARTRAQLGEPEGINFFIKHFFMGRI